MSKYFVSITLPKELQESLGQILPESRSWRKTVRRQLHLTLRYIGYADAAKVKEVDEKLASMDVPEFTLKLKEIGFFPEKGGVRIIWIGADKSSTLIELQGIVDKIVSEATGSKSEHSFTPHVTLARAKGAVDKEAVRSVISEIDEVFAFRVKSFQLMESRHAKGGTEHVTVKNYQLKTVKKQ